MILDVAVLTFSAEFSTGLRTTVISWVTWPARCTRTFSRRGGDRKPAVRVVLDALAEAAAKRGR